MLESARIALRRTSPIGCCFVRGTALSWSEYTRQRLRLGLGSSPARAFAELPSSNELSILKEDRVARENDLCFVLKVQNLLRPLLTVAPMASIPHTP